MSITYTLVLNSAGRITGSHNNAMFDVGWEDFLPEDNTLYSVRFAFQCVGGYYKDYSASNFIYQSALVNVDFGCRNFSYDPVKACQSTLLGIIRRDPQNATTIGASLNCLYDSNPPRTISKPTNSQLNVKIVNQNDGLPFLNTDSTGTSQTTDMTPWTMIIEFTPLTISVKVP